MQQEIDCLNNMIGGNSAISYAFISIPSCDDLLTDKSLEEILTANEMIIFQQYRNKKRQFEWLAGRLAAKSAAKKHPLLNHLTNVEILRFESGAPFICRCNNLTVSISHSGVLAVAVIAPFAIGIDIEKIESRPDAFVKTWFTENEQNNFNNMDLDQRVNAVNLAWTHKEAISKTIQLGGSIGFKQICSTSDTFTYNEQMQIKSKFGLTNQYAMTLAYEYR
jgi:phosphopantetheinyl transferase